MGEGQQHGMADGHPNPGKGYVTAGILHSPALTIRTSDHIPGNSIRAFWRGLRVPTPCRIVSYEVGDAEGSRSGMRSKTEHRLGIQLTNN